jgi:hypothetical protein
MKTISTLLALAFILSACVLSAMLYLQNDYNSSALLTIVSIISITLLIRSHGVFENEKASLNK